MTDLNTSSKAAVTETPENGATANEEKIRRPTLGWTLLHLRRSAHHFSRGLRKRLLLLSDEWVAAPLEEASWKLAERVERLGQGLFQKLDTKIDQLTEKKKSAISDEVELGRFDDEGGAMVAPRIAKRTGPKPAKTFERKNEPSIDSGTVGAHH